MAMDRAVITLIRVVTRKWGKDKKRDGGTAFHINKREMLYVEIARKSSLYLSLLYICVLGSSLCMD